LILGKIQVRRERNQFHGKILQKLIVIIVFCDLSCPFVFGDSAVELYGKPQKNVSILV